jgi:hypothetical protein
MYEPTNGTSKVPRSVPCRRKWWTVIAKSLHMRVDGTASWDVGMGGSFGDVEPQPTNDVSNDVGLEGEGR